MSKHANTVITTNMAFLSIYFSNLIDRQFQVISTWDLEIREEGNLIHNEILLFIISYTYNSCLEMIVIYSENMFIRKCVHYLSKWFMNVPL
ncbi:unnamed protein product [Heterobilharzia americana]|nr:unnamed protein product [Heterobilharzia americana]